MRGFMLFSALEEFDFVRTGAAAEQLGHAKATNNELIIGVSCFRVIRSSRRNNPLSSTTKGAFGIAQPLIRATSNILIGNPRAGLDQNGQLVPNR
jgi:hypothetical protein